MGPLLVELPKESKDLVVEMALKEPVVEVAEGSGVVNWVVQVAEHLVQTEKEA